jgi:hypothetical protein
MMTKKEININFDFTSDTPRYWDNFWQNNYGLGAGTTDPDSESKTLQEYHRIIYSKKLPNGKQLELQKGIDSYHYLTWENFRFGSDSIIASFRYHRYKWMLQQIEASLPNYKEYIVTYLRKSYTLGGEIIFPKRMWGINQTRGWKKLISDRFDLTLECIRRFYKKKPSLLTETIEKDINFFNLFIDFKGYVDFFFLQDLVTSDYEKVNLWLENEDFKLSPLPQTVDEYLCFISKELEFVKKRNSRIEKYCFEA